MKLLNKIKRKIYLTILNIGNLFKPFIQKKNYLGYTLYYSKGTSLVERIKQKGSIYEPETCNFLVGAIKDIERPCFIDIGANIGLISLYVIKHIPKVKVYAFEPGPHQNMLLRKTVANNNLNNMLEIFDYALSDKIGEATFCVHNTQDVSGDGFRDTGRAGDFKKIFVKTITLDEWWEKIGKPDINIIKIDTEGAELYVLKGAQKLLQECSPIIYFEMYSENYQVYNYTCNDILYLLEVNHYNLHSSNFTRIFKENIEDCLLKYSNYIATPKQINKLD